MGEDPRVEAVARALHCSLKYNNMADSDWDSGMQIGANNAWRTKIYAAARAALAAADAAAWRPISEAPRGKYHPYDPNGGSDCAQFVLSFNGHHAGVAYCIEDMDTGDIIWTGEDGKFWPEPTCFQYITPPQEQER